MLLARFDIVFCVDRKGVPQFGQKLLFLSEIGVPQFGQSYFPCILPHAVEFPFQSCYKISDRKSMTSPTVSLAASATSLAVSAMLLAASDSVS